MDAPVTEDEALTVACPRCRQPKDVQCVYVMPNAYGYSPEQLLTWPSMRAEIERVGTPTKRAHVERRAAVQRARRNAAAKAELERAWVVPRADADRIARTRPNRSGTGANWSP